MLASKGSAAAVVAVAMSRAPCQLEGLSPQERRVPVLADRLGSVMLEGTHLATFDANTLGGDEPTTCCTQRRHCHSPGIPLGNQLSPCPGSEQPRAGRYGHPRPSCLADLAGGLVDRTEPVQGVHGSGADRPAARVPADEHVGARGA